MATDGCGVWGPLEDSASGRHSPVIETGIVRPDAAWRPGRGVSADLDPSGGRPTTLSSNPSSSPGAVIRAGPRAPLLRRIFGLRNTAAKGLLPLLSPSLQRKVRRVIMIAPDALGPLDADPNALMPTDQRFELR